MKKILGIIAAILLCALTARASPMTATTGPPDGVQVSPANNASVAGDTDLILFDTALFMNTGQDTRLTTYNGVDDMAIMLMNSDLADDIGMFFGDAAIFMGDEIGLLKGPRNVALIHNQATQPDTVAATEVVNPANAGKIDAAFFMSDEAPHSNLAFIHAPPRDGTMGSCGLICEI